jgi:hypothetical protein
MAFITFVSPYKPIVCGIADYTSFLTDQSPPGQWDVISFDLNSYGVPTDSDPPASMQDVWYGIPSRDHFSAEAVLRGLRRRDGQVLWFQHEFGIWRDDYRFVDMLRGLSMPKVLTMHTLHFQSQETRYGLRSREYSFLRIVLPHIDAVTAFTDGAFTAVTGAFPEHAHKVHLLRHGTHLYPEVAGLSRAEAREKMRRYLMWECGLDQETRDDVRRRRIFEDPQVVLIGGAGFVTANKGIELIYYVRDAVQRMLPDKKLAAVYVGFLREVDSTDDMRRAAELKGRCQRSEDLFLQTYLPATMLPVFLRALDVHFYWPADCTQSGIIAHAVGAGATIAARDLEGVGETVMLAGGMAFRDLREAVDGVAQLVLSPGRRDEVSRQAIEYAERDSWRNQVAEHYALAEEIGRTEMGTIPSAIGEAARLTGKGEPFLGRIDQPREGRIGLPAVPETLTGSCIGAQQAGGRKPPANPCTMKPKPGGSRFPGRKGYTL